MSIIEYEEYKSNFDDLVKMGDLREYMVQEFVIRVFLQKVLPELNIIPTHTKINDSRTIHKYEKYCGVGKNGKTVTPDLCISRNWRWDNSGDVDYRALVEVKSPVGFKISDYVLDKNDIETRHCKPLQGLKDINKIRNSLVRDELLAHTQINNSKSLSKVIFTDGLAWLFIEGNEVKKRYDIGKRKLRKNTNDQGKTDYEFIGIEWLPSAKESVDDLVIRQMFNAPIDRDNAPREFEKLIGEIKFFAGMKK